jgi:hypothetical protein
LTAGKHRVNLKIRKEIEKPPRWGEHKEKTKTRAGPTAIL